MKRFIAVIFSFFYLFTAMGINLNVHFCHGKINSISLFIEDGKCKCDDFFAERMKAMGCCFDKNIKNQIEDEQLFTPNADFLFKLTTYIQNPFSTFDTRSLFHPTLFIEEFNLPPPKIIQDIPIRILHSIFKL